MKEVPRLFFSRTVFL